jgi:hypothetical protein
LTRQRFALGGSRGQEVYLDDVGKLSKRMACLGDNEVVEGDRVAGVFEPPASREHLVIRPDVFQNLNDDLLPGQQHRVVLNQSFAREIHKSLAASRERIKTEEQAMIDDTLRSASARRGVEIIFQVGAEQKLVAQHRPVPVENGLPCHEFLDPEVLVRRRRYRLGRVCHVRSGNTLSAQGFGWRLRIVKQQPGPAYSLQHKTLRQKSDDSLALRSGFDNAKLPGVCPSSGVCIRIAKLL